MIWLAYRYRNDRGLKYLNRILTRRKTFKLKQIQRKILNCEKKMKLVLKKYLGKKPWTAETLLRHLMEINTHHKGTNHCTGTIINGFTAYTCTSFIDGLEITSALQFSFFIFQIYWWKWCSNSYASPFCHCLCLYSPICVPNHCGSNHAIKESYLAILI